MSTDVTHAYEWRGRDLIGHDGEKIGKIDEIYLDEEGGQAEWALVNTGLFGSKSNFVPLAGAAPEGESVRVSVTKSQVKDAPGVDPGRELSQEEEAQLFRHYGFDYTTEGTVTAHGNGEARTEGYDTSGPTTDDAMTRSEEELSVGKATRERGRARLRKYVVTEEVQQTVPVQREEVRLEREPVTEANVGQATDGPAISEEEHEVVLNEEEVVAEKRVVPKERVRMTKDTVTEDHEVSEEVRKERIEADGERPGEAA